MHPIRVNLLPMHRLRHLSVRIEIKRLKGLGFLNNKGTNRFNARVVTGNGRITTAQRDVLPMLQPFTAAARSP